MPGHETLLELVEEAACGINMLDPANLNDLNGLLSTVSQINDQISLLDEGPDELLDRVKGSGAAIVDLLREMIKGETVSSDLATQTISQEVCTLQKFADGLSRMSLEDESSLHATVETDAVAETVISQDDVPLLVDFVAEAFEHIEAAEGGLLDLETKPEDQEALNLIFRAFHTIKGMAGFLNLTEIGALAHCAESLLDLARKGELRLTGGYTDLVFQSIDLVKIMITELQQAVESGSSISSQPALADLLARLKEATETRPEPTEKAAEPKIEDRTDTPDVDVPEPQGTAGLEMRPVNTSAHALSRQEAEQHAGTGRRASAVDEKIKVSTARLDTLVNMAGELVIAQLMVAEEVTKNLQQHYGLNQKVAHQGKIVRELQELSMSMRMVPIAGVFQKMSRLVRDLSHKAGKEIQFVTKGEETELDRNIVDKIADPLVAMIRNSIDHGVEPPESRQAAGKSVMGHIEVRAFHQAGHIVIEIQDDGRGLNKDRILQKAVDHGVVDPRQEMSDEDIYRLIFHAGLSTAQEITDVSGRGVGMDVVKKNIESLRGKIDIHSVPGEGTTFTIRMPLTLAIIDGQVIRVGMNRYIVPIHSIIHTLSPKSKQLSSLQNREDMVMVRGRLLPLVRLYKLFGVVPSSEDPTEALLVIVEEDGRQCALLVDELLSQQQVVIKSLGEGLGPVEGVSGGAIMGDGKVSLILDIPGLMGLAQK